MRIRTKAEARRILRRLGRNLPAEEARELRDRLLGATPARGQTKPGEMNKTEERFATEVLYPRKLAGEIRAYAYEAKTLVLSERLRCSYRPDFCVLNLDGSEDFYEIKGSFIREDSYIKLKWAAEKYYLSRFYLCVYKGGRWTIKLMGGQG
jgi:hypothetical protein